MIFYYDFFFHWLNIKDIILAAGIILEIKDLGIAISKLGLVILPRKP